MQYALLAAFTTAISYELINFGPRALIELIAAASTSHLSRFFGTRSKAGKQVATWRLLLIGLLLGLTVCLCIQFAPAVLLAGLWIMSRDWNSRAKNRNGVVLACSMGLASQFPRWDKARGRSL
jgi:hypothetical protein